MEGDRYESHRSGGGFGMDGTTAGFGWLIILLIFIVVLGALFGWGGRGRGFGGFDGFDGVGGFGHIGRGHGEGCGPSDWRIDRDVMEQGCKDRETTQCEADKTRALIERNYEEALKEKLFKAEQEISTLKLERYIDNKVDGVNGNISRVGREVEEIECKMLKKPEIHGIGTVCEGRIVPPVSFGGCGRE